MDDKDQNHGESSGPAVDLANLIAYTVGSLNRWSVNRSHELKEYNLTFAQVCALYAVRYGARTPGEVARRLRVTPRAITRTVESLEKHGLLTRAIDEQDRRKIHLEVTPAGHETSVRFEEDALAPLVRGLCLLTPGEFEAMQSSFQLLQKMLISLDHDQK